MEIVGVHRIDLVAMRKCELLLSLVDRDEEEIGIVLADGRDPFAEGMCAGKAESSRSLMRRVKRVKLDRHIVRHMGRGTYEINLCMKRREYAFDSRAERRIESGELAAAQPVLLDGTNPNGIRLVGSFTTPVDGDTDGDVLFGTYTPTE